MDEGPGLHTAKMATLSCRVCSAESAQYVCPRCNIRYCSLDCYKNHSTDCTQKFYRYDKLFNSRADVHLSDLCHTNALLWNFCRNVCQEELTSFTAGEDEIRKMKEILVRLHEQDLGPAEDSSSGASDSEDDLVPGLSCSRAMLLAEVWPGICISLSIEWAFLFGPICACSLENVQNSSA